MIYFAIAAGGALGAVARYMLSQKINRYLTRFKVVGTFFVNVSGAVLLGMVVNMPLPQTVLMVSIDGFLGAYTTFSTFMMEGVTLIENNKRLNAALYITLTFILAIFGFLFGAQIVT